MTFYEVRTAVFESHSRGDYQAGLDAITRYTSENDDETSDIAFWTMCLLSRLGRVDEACAEFARRLDEGFWWGEAVLGDPDFHNVQVHPAWQRLSALSLRRARAAKSVSRQPVSRSPESTVRATLVLFHGAAERPATMIDRCANALDHGCRLVALHGTEPFASARFGWPLEKPEQEVSRQLVVAETGVTPILVGYSQGGGLAGFLGWTRQIDCIGLILVNPSMSIRGVPIPNNSIASVPTYFLSGTNDWAIEDIRQAAKALDKSGVPVRLDERVGLRHEDWPDDFDETLQRAVDWILSG